jgi:CBS domain-containing protein
LTICPDCRFENIPGSDTCESCGHDLRNLSLPGPENAFTEHLMNDHLGEVSGKDAPVVAPGDPLAFAIHLMQRRETGAVLVVDGDDLVGVLTERDILLKAAGDKADLNAIAVRDIMTPDPVILREEDTLAVALHKMSVGGFRHIPLVTHGRPVGLISVRDVLRHLNRFIPHTAASPG